MMRASMVFGLLGAPNSIREMLLRKGKIILSWRHSGFSVHRGPSVRPGDDEAMQNIARCIMLASFSQERMPYRPDQPKVVYRSKDGKREKIFDALEWLAAMCSHGPNKGEQMIRYYGCSSDVSWGCFHSSGFESLSAQIPFFTGLPSAPRGGNPAHN